MQQKQKFALSYGKIGQKFCEWKLSILNKNDYDTVVGDYFNII